VNKFSKIIATIRVFSSNSWWPETRIAIFFLFLVRKSFLSFNLNTYWMNFFLCHRVQLNLLQNIESCTYLKNMLKKKI
jgi:hypothetical protein